MSATFERAAAIVILLVGGGIAGAVDDAPEAYVAPTSYLAASAFCTAVLTFGVRWPLVNLEVPGQPFFSDGNNDGIADPLQLRRGRLPSLAADLDGLAGQAPSELRGSLHTLAGDVKALASNSAPVTAAQSKQQAGPIERSARAVQRELTATGCRAAPAGTLPQDESQGRTPIVVFLFVLVNLPLIRRVWRTLRRPRANGDGTRFRGNLRRWKIQTITGTVVDVHPSYDTWTSSGGVWPDGSVTPRTTTTIISEHIRLTLTDRTPRDVTLVDFKAAPSEDDVVSVCVARKRSKTVNFAFLNLTTGQSILKLENLLDSMVIFIFALCFGGILTAFIAVFGGALWLIGVWLGLMIAFVIGVRRRLSMDLQPLWRRARAEIHNAPASR